MLAGSQTKCDGQDPLLWTDSAAPDGSNTSRHGLSPYVCLARSSRDEERRRRRNASSLARHMLLCSAGWRDCPTAHHVFAVQGCIDAIYPALEDGLDPPTGCSQRNRGECYSQNRLCPLSRELEGDSKDSCMRPHGSDDDGLLAPLLLGAW
jgi:hypothetical protein